VDNDTISVHCGMSFSILVRRIQCPFLSIQCCFKIVLVLASQILLQGWKKMKHL